MEIKEPVYDCYCCTCQAKRKFGAELEEMKKLLEEIKVTMEDLVARTKLW